MGIDVRNAFAQHIGYAQPGVRFKGSVSLQKNIVDWFALLIDYYFMNGNAGQGIVKQAAKQRFAFMHTSKRRAELLLCRAGERPEQHQRTAEQPRGKRQDSDNSRAAGGSASAVISRMMMSDATCAACGIRQMNDAAGKPFASLPGGKTVARGNRAKILRQQAAHLIGQAASVW